VGNDSWDIPNTDPVFVSEESLLDLLLSIPRQGATLYSNPWIHLQAFLLAVAGGSIDGRGHCITYFGISLLVSASEVVVGMNDNIS